MTRADLFEAMAAIVRRAEAGVSPQRLIPDAEAPLVPLAWVQAGRLIDELTDEIAELRERLAYMEDE